MTAVKASTRQPRALCPPEVPSEARAKDRHVRAGKEREAFPQMGRDHRERDGTAESNRDARARCLWLGTDARAAPGVGCRVWSTRRGKRQGRRDTGGRSAD